MHVPEFPNDIDKSLRLYMLKFEKWCKDLKNPKNIDPIDYKFYRMHQSAPILVLKRYAKRTLDLFENIENLEKSWIERCYNSGFVYLKNPGTYQCYGYDFKGYYGENLTKIKIPYKAGKEIKISKLPKGKDLQFGYYHVKITCEDPEIVRLFRFSEHNTYTNYSIKLARKLKKTYDIKIKMVQDDNPNAYVYENDDLVDGNDIFGKWYKIMTSLKKRYPKNKLVKHLNSALWGYMIQSNRRYYNDDTLTVELLSTHDIIDTIPQDEWKEYHTLIPRNQYYKYGFARVKAFLTSYGVSRLSRMLLESKSVDSIIRMQTDGVIFDKPHKFTEKNFVPEEKTTGKIHFVHVNCYNNMTEGYKTRDYDTMLDTDE